MRILFDHGTPAPLRQSLAGHTVSTAYEMGWATLENGDLLNAAEAAFDRRSGNELILTWSTNTAGFTVQTTHDLTPPATWVDVIHPPVLVGAQWTLTNAFSGSVQFYRLAKP